MLENQRTEPILKARKHIDDNRAPHDSAWAHARDVVPSHD